MHLPTALSPPAAASALAAALALSVSAFALLSMAHVGTRVVDSLSHVAQLATAPDFSGAQKSRIAAFTSSGKKIALPRSSSASMSTLPVANRLATGELVLAHLVIRQSLTNYGTVRITSEGLSFTAQIGPELGIDIPIRPTGSTVIIRNDPVSTPTNPYLLAQRQMARSIGQAPPDEPTAPDAHPLILDIAGTSFAPVAPTSILLLPVLAPGEGIEFTASAL